MDFNSLLAGAFARHASAPALLTQDGQILTFERLGRTVSVLAGRLRTEGVTAGQCVAVVTDNNAVRIALMLALARIGADAALVSAPSQLAARGQAIDATIRFADQASGVGRPIVFSQDWLSGSPETGVAGERAGKVIVSTSGSTGEPRYIRVHLDAYVNFGRLVADGSGESVGSVMVSIPVTAPFSVYLLSRSLFAGHGFCGMKPTARESLEVAAGFGVRDMMLTPLALAELVAAAEEGAPIGRLARISVFGAVAEGVLLARAQRVFGCPVCIINGASEIGQTSFGWFDPATYVTGWSGKPLKAIELRIGDGSPNGESGRLYIRPPHEFKVEGYIGGSPVYDDEGWFDSGDMANILPDGVLMIEGRADNLINLGGSKFAAERVEALVSQCKGVDICAATRVDPAGGLAPELGIAVVAGSGFDAGRTKSFVAEKLRTNARIRIVTCHALPALASGKLDRNALVGLFS